MEAAQPLLVDLRTDTVTLPTQAMRRAMMEADIGDEQKREDPTVLLLEENAAALLGQSDAVFVPSATMANQIAVRLLTNPGDELIAEESAHMLVNELGGPAVHSGVMIRPLEGERGMLDPSHIRAARRDPHSMYQPITRLVCVENTHNASGGSVWEIGRVDELAAVCRELELALHLDGSRLFNAAVACGHPASLASPEGSTRSPSCLSKGLGCPIGAVLAGSADFVARARRAEAPVRRCDAPGGDHRRGGGVRTRSSRRSPCRRSPPGAIPRRGAGRAAAFRSGWIEWRRTSSRSTWHLSA